MVDLEIGNEVLLPNDKVGVYRGQTWSTFNPVTRKYELEVFLSVDGRTEWVNYEDIVEVKKSTTWDEDFINLAIHWAEIKSKDPSTKVGAVIANDRKQIISMGYNGLPRGVNDYPSRYEDRQLKYKLVVHAEANAILNATSSCEGSTMYVTMFPCNECAKLIIQAGIKRVVAPEPNMSREASNYHESKVMFNEAGIEITYV